VEKALSSHELLWHTYHQWAFERGRLIVELLRKWMPLEGTRILDAGCGVGGASKALAEAGALVTAVDLAPLPPDQVRGMNIRYQCADLSTWRSGQSEDAVILWDVLEHLPDPDRALRQLHTLLRENGLLLIATPNRLSLFNLFCDPHYGLPFLSLCKRKTVRRIVGSWLHWHKPDKPDFPQLLSLRSLDCLLRDSGFSWRFIHRALFAAAIRHPQGLWNRPAHLRLIQFIKKAGGISVLAHLMSDKISLLNRWLMPTFFILAEAQPKHGVRAKHTSRATVKQTSTGRALPFAEVRP
jgi:SAM-dependent methyltransferase